METLQYLDKEVFLYLNNLGESSYDWFWVFITHKWASLPLYGLVVWLIFRKTGFKNTFIRLVLIGLMIIAAYGISHLVKYGVMRPRPCNMNFDARTLVDDCGTYGFFSSHATSAFALTLYIGKILKTYYRQAIFWMIVWASLMSYSRIYVGKHYPGDIIIGCIVGLLIGWLFYQLQERLVRKFT